MGIERGTPGYMIREEIDRDKLKGRARVRAMEIREKTGRR